LPGVRERHLNLSVLLVGMAVFVAAGLVIGSGGWLTLASWLSRFQVLPLPFWLAGIWCIVSIARHLRSDWLAPINLVFGLFLWFFFVAPIILITMDRFQFLYTSDLGRYLLKAGWLILLAVLSFSLGYSMPVSGKVKSFLGGTMDKLNAIDRGRLGPLVIVGFMVGTGIVLYRYYLGGGFDYLLETRTVVGGGDWWIGVGTLVVPAACVLAYCYWGREKKLAPFLAVVAMLAFTFVSRAITGRRAWALEPIVMVALAARYLEKKIRVNLLTGLLGAGLIVLIVLWLGDYRAAGAYTQVVEESWLLKTLHATGRLEELLWVVEFVPHEIPFQWGLGFLAETFQIPIGSIFAWYGVTYFHTGSVTTLAVGPSATAAGAASTPIGPLYHEFAVPGVVLGFLAFGWFTKTLYTVLVHERPSPASLGIYALFLHQTWLFTVGGSWQGLYHLQVTVAWMVLLLLFARERRPVRQSQATRSWAGERILPS
jgi:oligosaccharide repeat unit polymerase